MTKGHKETFGGVHYLDGGDDFTGVYMCHNLGNCIFQICTAYCMHASETSVKLFKNSKCYVNTSWLQSKPWYLEMGWGTP